MTRRDADLEIVLQWRQDAQFDVSLAYDDPGSASDRRDLVQDPIDIDTDALALLTDDNDAYGTALSRMLFAPNEVRTFYAQARAVAADRGLPMHLRLLVGPRAPTRFQAVRWESLRDPVDGEPIATRRNVLLSRYLSSGDWNSVAPPPRHDLRALVVIANPSDLANYRPAGRALEPLDVEGERRRAQTALARMQSVELPAGGSATLAAVTDALEQDVDVLFLVCHGALVGDEPRLFLERPDGTTDPVDGGQLAKQVATLRHRPTLAVLCSCQSAGNGEQASTTDEGALSALGPRLAAAGVAAVVAMQGNVTMRTAGRFLSEFFGELAVDGVVDRAVAVARTAVRDEPDWWVPVLFSRLRSGRTYYQPAFAEGGDWTFAALVGQIRDRACTPVLGSAIAEAILPSRESIARHWADRWQMPIAPHARGDLAKVAQYLRVRTSPETPRTELRRFVLTELRAQLSGQVPEELFRPDRLPELVHAVTRQSQHGPGQNPYQILAGLDLPVYVTTAWTGLIEYALVEAGKQPIVRSFPWQSDRDVEGPLVFDPNDRDRPLVYHLFGRIEDLESVVLTEDDYFAWFTAWISRGDLIPNAIRAALTSRSLLFVGYGLYDWEFRVLFHAIKSFPGSFRLRNFLHVGVQLRPEDNQDIDAEAAQDYLESYFTEDRMHIYWGQSQRFLEEVQRRMKDSI